MDPDAHAYSVLTQVHMRFPHKPPEWRLELARKLIAAYNDGCRSAAHATLWYKRNHMKGDRHATT